MSQFDEAFSRVQVQRIVTMKCCFSLAIIALAYFDNAFASITQIKRTANRYSKALNEGRKKNINIRELYSEEQSFWSRELGDSTSLPSEPLNKCGITDSQRASDIEELLFEVSGQVLRDEIESPQSNAMNWLITEDELFVCPGVNDKKLLQRYAMAVFYFSTEGEGWKECFSGDDACGSTDNDFEGQKPFLSGVNECEWAGINACNADKCITKIVFEEQNDLFGTIPEELRVLEFLEVISLEDQAIGGPLPSGLGEIMPLRVIDFDFNQLTGSIPDSYYSLENLVELDLNDNKLTGTISDNIDGMLSLEFMQLHFNKFTGTIPDSIVNVETLTVAEFQDNGFTGDVPLCMGSSETPDLVALSADCLSKVTCGSDCGCECF